MRDKMQATYDLQSEGQAEGDMEGCQSSASAMYVALPTSKSLATRGFAGSSVWTPSP